jgi:hypothetical protein
MCHRNSGQCSMQISLNDDHHATFIPVSHCITLRTDLMHRVEIFAIAYGTSRKSRRRRSIRNGKEVEQYLSKTSKMFYMPSIASRKCGNVIGPRHLSIRLHG